MELYEAEADLPQKAQPKRRLAAPKAQEDDDDWGHLGAVMFFFVFFVLFNLSFVFLFVLFLVVF